MHRIVTVEGTISTDDIIPGKYKHMHADVSKLAGHVFENRFPGLASDFQAGDAIWCDSLFGIGSSREQAATSLKAAGVALVIAPDFGRIFYRNAWNVGLPAIRCPRPSGARTGVALDIDWTDGGLIVNDERHAFSTPPARLMEMRSMGGLLPWLKAQPWPRDTHSVQFAVEAWNVCPN